MTFVGDVFISDMLKKPVLDPKGEELGKVKDFIIVKGEPLPKINAIIIEIKNNLYELLWKDIGIFNKRIISAKIFSEAIMSYETTEEHLLAVRDILDKQIVDANGVKVVRVNDIRIEGYNSDAILTAVDVGMRGLLRRLGFERGGEKIMKVFRVHLPSNLISWNYIQPLAPKLSAISLTVPRQMVSELHPADIAEIISQVSHIEGATFFKNLDADVAAEALSELKPETQVEIISEMNTSEAADIIEEMPPDEAADVISDLSAEKAKEILEHIEKKDAEDIQELLCHEEDTAGGLMTNEFITMPSDITIKEAIEQIRQNAPEVEAVYYIYITDKDKKLHGVVSLRDLLITDDNSKLSDIMETKIKAVHPEDDEMEVAEIISKYNLVAIPVINEDGLILGIVTIDDIIDRILPPAAKRKRRKM